MMYRHFFKPLCDTIAALFALLVFLPILIIVTLFLSIANNGSPFFFQIRPGKHGKLFKIIKFKTMNDKKDEQGNLLSDDLRLTKIGSIVRKTSLDELPQLVNVLIGDMSMVGPRPLLPEYLPLYDKQQAMRHYVKPGITGWAQINGRNAISWNDKFKLDLWYVEHQSFILDLKIILKTIKKVFISEGVTATGQATTIKFKGNE